MSSLKRTRAAPAKKRHIAPPPELDDDLFEAAFNQANESDQDSDHSEYGKKSKGKPKRRKTAAFRPGPAPKLPELSDDEFEDSRAGSPELGGRPTMKSMQRQVLNSGRKPVETPICSGSGRSLPKILQIQVPTSKNGHTTINLSLVDILCGQSGDMPVNTPSSNRRVFEDNEATLVDESPTISPMKTVRLSKKETSTNYLQRTGFLHLPFEIRLRVYRQVFVTQEPIDFSSRDNFGRSAGFLRTCHLVHDEGCAILYGENAFHFERSSHQRGHFFDKIWKEIGFKDVRRFLDLIGRGNIACLKYVSFTLFDAYPSYTSYLEDEERRFVNDPVIHYIFNLIGSHATLSKLAFTFGGRRAMSLTDFHFLKAITSMRCHEFINVTTDYRHTSRVNCGVLEKIKQIMVIAREDEDEVDLKKRKQPVVKMQHEKPSSSRYSGW